MRLVLQRVSRASVSVDDSVVSEIGRGVLLLVGVSESDSEADVDAAVDKIANLRIFEDKAGKMNHSLLDRHVSGEMLVVSQFTLLGDVRKGRRPSFSAAAQPKVAAPLIDRMVERFRGLGVSTSTGVFGASMEVELVNDGPVTLVVDVRNARPG